MSQDIYRDFVAQPDKRFRYAYHDFNRAIAAHVQYRAGEAQLEAFDTEMRAATLELTNILH